MPQRSKRSNTTEDDAGNNLVTPAYDEMTTKRLRQEVKLRNEPLYGR